MKYTLLQIVQSIMSAMEADEINSITDTTEAQDVALLVRSCYFDIITRANLPKQFAMFSLEASGDTTKPVLMTMPTDFISMEWLKYNKATADNANVNMQYVQPLPLNEFLDRQDSLTQSDSFVGSFSQQIGSSLITVLYRNDVAPTYYTTADDGTVIFDSYDSAVDSTLQKNKTRAYGQKDIEWTMDDSFVPDLNPQEFSLLMNESKAMAFAEKKQTTHAKAELNARRGWVSLHRQKHKVKTETPLDAAPNYGRR